MDDGARLSQTSTFGKWLPSKLQRQRSLGASKTRLEQSRTLLPPPETQQNNAESLEARRMPNNKDNIQQIIIIIK